MKSLGVLIIAVILAAGTNFTHLNTTREYTKYTTRGGSNLSRDEKLLRDLTGPMRQDGA